MNGRKVTGNLSKQNLTKGRFTLDNLAISCIHANMFLKLVQANLFVARNRRYECQIVQVVLQNWVLTRSLRIAVKRRARQKQAQKHFMNPNSSDADPKSWDVSLVPPHVKESSKCGRDDREGNAAANQLGSQKLKRHENRMKAAADPVRIKLENEQNRPFDHRL